MKHLTIRNMPAAVAKALEREKRGKGQSLNQTVIGLLARALGIDPDSKRSNGLARLAGTWSQQELKRFDRAIEESSEQIDDELWS